MKRLLQLIPILFVITFLSFGMMRLAGSDAVLQKMENTGMVMSQDVIEQAQKELGLDKPFLVQYVVWLKNLLHGDMGVSYISGEDIFDTFLAKLPATLLMTVVSIGLTIVISIPLGVLAAVKQNRMIDYLIRFCSFMGNSMPNFFVALLLMLILAIRLKWFPVISDGVSLQSVALPALTLAIAMSAKYLRQVRATVLDELGKPYVSGAKARGIPFSTTLVKSVLRASLVTILTLLTLSIGSLLGGTAIVESIFLWDGVGKLAVDAISMRDYPMIQAYVMWMAIIYVGVNLLTGSENSPGRNGRMKKEKTITVRRQKIQPDRTKKRLCFFLFLTALLLLTVVFAEQICPYDPNAQDTGAALLPPGAGHLAGTDRFGRDMLSRILVGLKTSVTSTLILVVVVTVTGSILGLICGYFGGIADTVIMRISDICLAFPGLVFAMAIAALLNGGISNAVLALALISWPKYARIARSQTLTVKNTNYMAASQLAGCTAAQMIWRHILPNIAGPILVTSMLDIGTMMMELAGLSFLGLGAQPPTAELGNMMSGGRSMLQTYPWVVIGPGLAIFTAVVIFNLLGDAMRDYLDPHNGRG